MSSISNHITGTKRLATILQAPCKCFERLKRMTLTLLLVQIIDIGVFILGGEESYDIGGKK